MRGSLRAIERPELPELAVWLPAGLIAMAAKMTATSKRRIRRDYRRDSLLANQAGHHLHPKHCEQSLQRFELCGCRNQSV